MSADWQNRVSLNTSNTFCNFFHFDWKFVFENFHSHSVLPPSGSTTSFPFRFHLFDFFIEAILFVLHINGKWKCSSSWIPNDSEDHSNSNVCYSLASHSASIINGYSSLVIIVNGMVAIICCCCFKAESIGFHKNLINCSGSHHHQNNYFIPSASFSTPPGSVSLEADTSCRQLRAPHSQAATDYQDWLALCRGPRDFNYSKKKLRMESQCKFFALWTGKKALVENALFMIIVMYTIFFEFP